MRNYKKLKTLSDFNVLDAPVLVNMLDSKIKCPFETQMVLRMLVKPKYSDSFYIPSSLEWLKGIIYQLTVKDENISKISNFNKWCYVTVRHGLPTAKTDDEWHFDGASFRIELIPERNYIWVNHTPTQYKKGKLNIPDNFDPCVHNLFTFADNQLKNKKIQEVKSKKWYLINPFCLHRRNPNTPNIKRTFIRISFTDIEGRDVNNTPNPLLVTDAYGRDPVKNFRNNLLAYY